MGNQSEEVMILASRNGLPYVHEPANIDLWPSQKAALQMFQVAVRIVNLGFEGLMIDHYKISTGQTVANFMTNPETPEGRVFQNLAALVEQGKELDVESIISIIELIYLKEGLKLPYEQRSEGVV